VSSSSPDNVLLDFTSGDASAVAWRGVGDPVMGGRSESGFHSADGHASFAGRVSLERGGGFASVRCDFPVRDLAAHAGIAVRLRGDGRRYRFQLRDSSGFDTVVHRVSFTTRAGTWETVRFPFAAFEAAHRGRPVPGRTLDPGRIHGFGFLIADRQEGPFRLDVAWIAVFDGTA
jgi:monofunctional biosynthetic peptidoglycan transglycosylase